MQDLQKKHVCDWKFLLKYYCNKNNRKFVFPPVFITFKLTMLAISHS